MKLKTFFIGLPVAVLLIIVVGGISKKFLSSKENSAFQTYCHLQIAEESSVSLPTFQEPQPKFSNPVQPVRTLAATGTTLSLAISSDGKQLISGNDDSRDPLGSLGYNGTVQKHHDSSLQIWDLQTGTLLYTVPSDYPVFFVAVSPDGKTIASSSANVTVKPTALYNSYNLLDHDSIHNSIRLISSSKGLPLGNITELKDFYSSVSSVTFSADEKFLAGSHRNGVTVWDLSTGKTSQTFTKKSKKSTDKISFNRAFAFNLDNQTLAFTLDNWPQITASRRDRPSTSLDNQTLAFTRDNPKEFTIQLWNWRTDKQVVTLSQPPTTIQAIKHFWSKESTGKQKESTGKQGAISNQLPAIKEESEALAISQDGQMLIAAFKVDILDRKWEQYLKSNLEHYDIHSLIQIWDLQKRKLIHTLNYCGRTRSMAVSPDGKWLATGGVVLALDANAGNPVEGRINLWDLQTAELIRSLKVPNPVLSTVFSPDGKTLVTGGSDKLTATRDDMHFTIVGKDEAIKIWQVEQLSSGK